MRDTRAAAAPPAPRNVVDFPMRAERQAGHAAGTALDWGAVLAIVAVALDLRPGIVSVGPVLTAIRSDFALTHLEAALLTAIPALLMSVLAWPTPWLARRFGRDTVMTGGLCLLGLSVVWRAAASSVAALLMSTTGIGAGVAVAGTMIGGFIKSSFPTRAALVMGVYAAALSLGSTPSAAATEPIARTMGWRFATGAWSVLGLLALQAWHWSRRPGAAGSKAPSASRASAGPLRNLKAWLIAIHFGGINFLFYALLAWAAAFYQELGSPVSRAGLLLALFMAAIMGVNPLLGLVSRTSDRRGWLVACDVLALAGVLAMTLLPKAFPFVPVVLCGAGLGGGFTLGMTLPLDNARSPEEADAWNALVLLVGYVVAAAGPIVVGTLRDVSGDCHAAMGMLTAVVGGMLFLAPFLKPAQQAP